jgi:hypothetical protein
MVLPYLKGLIIKLWFSIWFHISCVVIVFRYLWIYCDIFYSGIWLLTIPSLIGSIVWCFPNSRVFMNKVEIYCYWISCGVFLLRSLVLDKCKETKITL